MKLLVPVYGVLCYLLGSVITHWANTNDRVLVTRAVAFESCDVIAGILVINADGSSVWYRPPYEGLMEATKDLPDDQKWSVSFCPKVPEETA